MLKVTYVTEQITMQTIQLQMSARNVVIRMQVNYKTNLIESSVSHSHTAMLRIKTVKCHAE